MITKNKIQYVIYLYCALFPLCGIGQAASAPMTTNQKLEVDFEKSVVAPAQLEAFELRAVQKIYDLANYLDYIGDQNLEVDFRAQAQALALELFSDKETPFYYFENGKKVKTTVGQYLEQLAKKKEIKKSFEFFDVSKNGEAQVTEEGHHYWFVRFRQTETKETQSSTRTIVTLKISLQQIEKKFGSKTKKIWEVFLDEMISLELTP